MKNANRLILAVLMVACSMSFAEYDAEPATVENLGLENVDNTSDVDKPVSTAQAAAIALSGTVSHRWDNIYAESAGLCVGPAQPSTFITNLVYGAVTQQVEFLSFDDTTTEYTAMQTWQTWQTWNSNIVVRGATWYADATPDADWTLHYWTDGLTASTVTLNPTVSAAGATNLDHWAVSTNLTGVVAGDTVNYFLSRDVADTGTGDVYLRSMAIGWEQE